MECTIINPALSLLMKHLVIGQRLKTAYFKAFHWSPHGSLVSTGQHLVTTRVVHLPKRTEQKLNYQIGPKQTLSPAIAAMHGPHSQSDQGVRAVHSCNSWFFKMKLNVYRYIISFIHSVDFAVWYH